VKGILQDVRYAARRLRKTLGFTCIALLTIAIGIAANVSVFAFRDALFLRSVPAKNPSGLVRIRGAENDSAGFSYPEYVYVRDHAKSLQSLVAHYSTAPLYVRANGASEEITGAVVSSNYFAMLGLRPYIGRFFNAEEDSIPDRDAVAVLGFGFWKRTYDGDPSVLGKTLSTNGKSFTVIGVMPPEFRGIEIGGSPNELWIPTAMIRVGYRFCDGLQPSCTILQLIGRLAPGANAHGSQAELSLLTHSLSKNISGFEERAGVSVEPAIGISRDHYFPIFIRLLTWIGAVVLVIVCANIGGLLLARGKARYYELAMRQALGATPIRIIRQLLTENLLLAIAGGTLGVVISVWSSRWLAMFYSVDAEGYRRAFDLQFDAAVLAYSVLITVIAGLLFGLIPCWQASRPDFIQSLRSASVSQNASGNKGRLVLTAAQVALALALVVAAGLLARSAAEINAGKNLDLSGVLGLRLRPQLMSYSPPRAQAFTREVLQRLRTLPGVKSVSLAKGIGLVWRANEEVRMRLPGETYGKPGDEPVIGVKPVAPAYFATSRIPFTSGRDFTDSDNPESNLVVIVNETLAHKFFRDSLSIGRTIWLNGKSYQVVGIVKDAQTRSIAEGPEPVAYTAFWQDAGLVDSRLCVRTEPPTAATAELIRKAIASIDPNVPVTEVMPLFEQVRGAYTDARVASAVLDCAAAIGLVLSAMGLFAVIAYEVDRRRREIGIRIAVGAKQGDVVRLVLKQGVVAILAGSVAGIGLALLTTRLLASWLFGVRPSDPSTLAAAVLSLVTVAVLACYVPARRAAEVDPMVALRYE
jgi:predicted permease